MERSLEMGGPKLHRTLFLAFIFSYFWLPEVNGQYIKEKMRLWGYVKYMNSLFIADGDSVPIITDNLIHNRLNYTWYINKHWEFNTSMRNRIFWGELVKLQPNLPEGLKDDNGVWDLSAVWMEGYGYVGHTIFDRLNITARYGASEVIFGRQRINWGTCLVWNPNDIYNAFSFFDFDYEERPGTDAFLYRYYFTPVSSIEGVYGFGDSLRGSTISGMLKLNKNGYDLQGFLGYQRGYYTVGLGWAGEIKGAGFRGEFSLWEPDASSTGPSQLVGGIDIDYTFPNTIYIHGAYLYNSEGINTSTGNYNDFFLNRELGARTLSPTRHSIFAEVSGQLSPIIRGSLFGITNPQDASFFWGPMISWSVANNFELLFNGQFFVGPPNTAYGGYGNILYLRFKYSF